MADEARLIRACLQAALRRDFEREEGVTVEWLHGELQQQYSLEQVEETLKEASAFLREAMARDYEMKELEAALASRSAAWQGAALKFWRAQRAHVHEIAVSQSTWNNKLEKFAWRVDVKQRERQDSAGQAPRNEPTALVEFVIASQGIQSAATSHNKAPSSTASHVVRFEMGKEQVAATARSLEAIQKALEAASRK